MNQELRDQMKGDQFRLKLLGKTVVFIDWANVYYWKNSLKKEVDLGKILKYLRGYREVKEVWFYFGTDEHPKSKLQLQQAKKLECKVVTKPVKFLPKKVESGEIAWVRKCDFDLEIGLDCFEKLEKFKSFIFFSGDGDFATLYERLVEREKQVIVVYVRGSLGREVWQMKKGVFKVELPRFGDMYKKMSPRRRRGAQLPVFKQKVRKKSR